MLRTAESLNKAMTAPEPEEKVETGTGIRANFQRTRSCVTVAARINYMMEKRERS